VRRNHYLVRDSTLAWAASQRNDRYPGESVLWCADVMGVMVLCSCPLALPLLPLSPACPSPLLLTFCPARLSPDPFLTPPPSCSNHTVSEEEEEEEEGEDAGWPTLAESRCVLFLPTLPCKTHQPCISPSLTGLLPQGQVGVRVAG
jgi:hypothetical protein